MRWVSEPCHVAETIIAQRRSGIVRRTSYFGERIQPRGTYEEMHTPTHWRTHNLSSRAERGIPARSVARAHRSTVDSGAMRDRVPAAILFYNAHFGDSCAVECFSRGFFAMLSMTVGFAADEKRPWQLGPRSAPTQLPG